MTEADLPQDTLEMPVIFYDQSEVSADGLLPTANEFIRKALLDPSGLTSSFVRPRTVSDSVFISYSHKDKEYLDRLLVHLRPLEREGLIGLWADTAMTGGEHWRDEIKQALERARLAILLISPDFLDSEFILNNELPELLFTAQSRGTYILPIILSPCRFARDRLLSQFQAINNPAAPLASMSHAERELIYDKVRREDREDSPPLTPGTADDIIPRPEHPPVCPQRPDGTASAPVPGGKEW